MCKAKKYRLMEIVYRDFASEIDQLSDLTDATGGVGGLLAVSIDGQFYVPCTDNNGNIVAYLNESGTTVASYTNDAFGNTQLQSGAMADFSRIDSRLSITMSNPASTTMAIASIFPISAAGSTATR